MQLRSPLAVALVALFVLVACKSKREVGNACSVPDEVHCMDASSALVCRDKWSKLACTGPNGCKEAGRVTCDVSLANEGESCLRMNGDTYACSTDRSKALICKKEAFQLWRQCRGAGHCTIANNNVNCDMSEAETGDPCSTGFTCGVGKTMYLGCQNDHFVALSSCRGPKKCSFEGDAKKVVCDVSIAVEGDPCDVPNRVACSSDAKSALICRGGKYVRDRECKRKTGCEYHEGGRIVC